METVYSRELQAARVLYSHGSKAEASGILEHVWNSFPAGSAEHFAAFSAMMEVWAHKNPYEVAAYLLQIAQGETQQDLWNALSISERAIIFDWQGQLEFVVGDKDTAFESLSRAASLGRDASLTWRLLGELYVTNGDLELGVRYVRRSLQVHRQLDLDLLSGKDYLLGAFSGAHPVALSHGVEEFLKVLLLATKLAKGQKNLKAVRELIVDMIHQFPYEERLLKIRLLMEKSIVQASLGMPVQGYSSQQIELR